MAAGVAPGPSSSAIAGRRARLNSCWSIVSNSQPSDATTSTNQCPRLSSRYQGPLAAGTEADTEGFESIICSTIRLFDYSITRLFDSSIHPVVLLVSESMSLEVKHLGQGPAERLAVVGGWHHVPHVMPPATADIGRGHGFPALDAVELHVGEQIVGVLVHEDRVGLHAVRPQRVREFLPDRLMATGVLVPLAGIDGHPEGPPDHDRPARTCSSYVLMSFSQAPP